MFSLNLGGQRERNGGVVIKTETGKLLARRFKNAAYANKHVHISLNLL